MIVQDKEGGCVRVRANNTTMIEIVMLLLLGDEALVFIIKSMTFIDSKVHPSK